MLSPRPARIRAPPARCSRICTAPTACSASSRRSTAPRGPPRTPPTLRRRTAPTSRPSAPPCRCARSLSPACRARARLWSNRSSPGTARATAGGELAHALKLAARFFGTADGHAPLAGVTPDRIAAFAAAYGDLVRRDTGATTAWSPTSRSRTSSASSACCAGRLPGARFVVVHRDPRDIALSIYKNHFRTGTHRYATDLGRHRLCDQDVPRQRRLVEGRLPGAIHEIRYEDLVADPEAAARALIAAVGLDWEDGCLAFHEARGAVRTLSLHRSASRSTRGGAGLAQIRNRTGPFIAPGETSHGTERHPRTHCEGRSRRRAATPARHADRRVQGAAATSGCRTCSTRATGSSARTRCRRRRANGPISARAMTACRST